MGSDSRFSVVSSSIRLKQCDRQLVLAFPLQKDSVGTAFLPRWLSVSRKSTAEVSHVLVACASLFSELNVRCKLRINPRYYRRGTISDIRRLIGSLCTAYLMPRELRFVVDVVRINRCRLSIRIWIRNAVMFSVSLGCGLDCSINLV